MGFLKKLKDTAENGVEKGTVGGKQVIEEGTGCGAKAYNGTKDAPQKGYAKAKND